MTRITMQTISAPFCLLLAFVVGREVLAAAAPPRCGRHLVSGLFARSRLPLGYSLVGSVPRGACRLNVTELAPSDNYIALKLSNSSFIINGHFAVSAPGAYDAGGARFFYSRAGDVDTVLAIGPLLHAVDIMVLYTKRNVDIRYEYYIESSPDDELATTPFVPIEHVTAAPKHSRRHHNFRSHSKTPATNDIRYPELGSTLAEGYSEGDEETIAGPNRFTWKISGYSQCTRTCGGGHQISQYRCVESSGGGAREVSPGLCAGPAPGGRRRRCGHPPCPPRWRAAAWAACPACGPAVRTRIVGCVQENAKVIAKVSDSKCPAPKPETEEKCNIPDCKTYSYANDMFEPTVVDGDTDTFKEGPVYTVSVNDSGAGTEFGFSAAGWLYTEWSECVGWCVGGGVQTRGVTCADPAGCTPRLQPEARRPCSPQQPPCEAHDGRWFTGDWSRCSAPCGGRQVRGALCVGGAGRRLKDSACRDPKPETERPCGDQCEATWYFGDWSECKGSCTSLSGEQRRAVWCAGRECAAPRPAHARACRLDNCAKDELPNDVYSECVDKLKNCVLAAQARLCRYNYYNVNCCRSCRRY